MDFAIEKGVTLNIGALETLIHFKDKLKGKNIFIRVNPKVGAGETRHVITGGP
jgi:diaminopimelate decarboxylase